MFVIGLIMVATGCAQQVHQQVNPYTDRVQVFKSPYSNLDRVKTLTEQAYRGIRKEFARKLPEDLAEFDIVLKAFERIKGATDFSRYRDTADLDHWEMTIIRDQSIINLIAFPGGKFILWTGAVSLAKDEVGLAAILSYNTAEMLGSYALERASLGLPPPRLFTPDDFGWASKPLDVDMMLEVDYIALLLAARAGYDPRAVIQAWRRMELAMKGYEDDNSRHRLHALESHLLEAIRIYSEKA